MEFEAAVISTFLNILRTQEYMQILALNTAKYYHTFHTCSESVKKCQTFSVHILNFYIGGCLFDILCAYLNIFVRITLF